MCCCVCGVCFVRSMCGAVTRTRGFFFSLLPHPSSSARSFVPQTVRLYEAAKNESLFQYAHKSAVLDCCFQSDDAVGFSGGLDGKLVMYACSLFALELYLEIGVSTALSRCSCVCCND